MSNLDYFKKQAKNFLKDWETQKQTVDSDGFVNYHYNWKFFDVDDLFYYFELSDNDRQEIKLARAQHYIAKMVGFKKWEDLTHATETELYLSTLLLHRFKNSSDVQQWNEAMQFAGIYDLDPEIKLDYARHYYNLGDSKQIANLPLDKIEIVSDKAREQELKRFDDEHNPAGTLRLDSKVKCTVCKKTFDFTESKVIKDNGKNLTMVVCKNYPKCRGTYLDYLVLTPTLILDETRIEELKRQMNIFPNITMNTKVRCLHCDKEFLYKDAKVVAFPMANEPHVMCKHYPDCDGSLIDMMVNDN